MLLPLLWQLLLQLFLSLRKLVQFLFGESSFALGGEGRCQFSVAHLVPGKPLEPRVFLDFVESIGAKTGVRVVLDELVAEIYSMDGPATRSLRDFGLSRANLFTKTLAVPH